MHKSKPKFFPSQRHFRQWLQMYHAGKSELWVGYYKKHTGRPSMTWPQSVDEGLCFGWIDGLRRSIDDTSYQIRFTPRKPRSHWSHVNTKRMTKLTKLGLVTTAGLAAFARRTETNSGLAAYERGKNTLSKNYEKKFREDKKAWSYYSNLPPSTRKSCDWWVMSAKKEETRQRRLDLLIMHSAREELIPAMAWGADKSRRTNA